MSHFRISAGLGHRPQSHLGYGVGLAERVFQGARVEENGVVGEMQCVHVQGIDDVAESGALRDFFRL